MSGTLPDTQFAQALLPGHAPSSGCEFTSAFLQMVLEAVGVQVRLHVNGSFSNPSCRHAKVATTITYLETAGALDEIGRSVRTHEDTSKVDVGNQKTYRTLVHLCLCSSSGGFSCRGWRDRVTRFRVKHIGVNLVE